MSTPSKEAGRWHKFIGDVRLLCYQGNAVDKDGGSWEQAQKGQGEDNDCYKHLTVMSLDKDRVKAGLMSTRQEQSNDNSVLDKYGPNGLFKLFITEGAPAVEKYCWPKKGPICSYLSGESTMQMGKKTGVDVDGGGWDRKKRGTLGETPLHICFLNNTETHIKLAKILLKHNPGLALDMYEGAEYKGGSALHFAVVNGDLDSVKLLVELFSGTAAAAATDTDTATDSNTGTDNNKRKLEHPINTRATGEFFKPKTNNYDGDTYLGEYPLAFAACLGHKEIYDHLLDNGANPNLQDTMGNTVLHMCVIKDKPDMYEHAVKHKGDKKPNQWIRNSRKLNGSNFGLTPMELACKLGRPAVFAKIMELQKTELWTYSKLTCSLHPLVGLDTIKCIQTEDKLKDNTEAEIDWSSCLMRVVKGNTHAHTEMLQTGVLRELLDQKWETYLKGKFTIRAGVLALHIIAIVASAWLLPKISVESPTDPKEISRDVMELIAVCCSMYALINFIRECLKLKVRLAFLFLINTPFKAVYLGSCIAQLSLLVIRPMTLVPRANLDQLQIDEEIVLILTIPSTCLMIFHYSRVFMGPRIGAMVNIITAYLRKDVLPFSAIVAIVVVTFASVFYHLWKYIDDESVTTFLTPHGSLMSMFHLTVGEFSYREFHLTRELPLTMIIFIMFMIMMPILLLNMLIAMMTTTIDQITEKAEKDWIHQKARTMILMETHLSKEELLKARNAYSTDVSHKEEIKKLRNPIEEAKALRKKIEVSKRSNKETNKGEEKQQSMTCHPSGRVSKSNDAQVDAVDVDFGGTEVTT